MCFFRGLSANHLEKHIIRVHRNDPLFKVKCTNNGCGATYRKWKSYQQHVSRYHSQACVNRNEFRQAVDEALDAPNGVQDDIVDDQYMGDKILASREQLTWHAARFLIDIRENCKTSHVALEKIIDGVTQLMTTCSSNLLAQLDELKNPDTNLIDVDQVRTLLTESCSPSILFESIRSKWYLDKFLINELQMVCAEPWKIGTSDIWKKRKDQSIPRLIEVEDRAYIVPFLRNLKNLLLNEDFRTNIDNVHLSEDDVLRTVLDGSYYKENDFFRNHPKALAIILYYDELGVANALGSHSSKEKLAMFYWSSANIDPKVRSTEYGVQLLAIVKAKLLKKHGLEKVLQPFISDIKVLQTDGISIIVNGAEKNYKGSVIFCAGDTPASAFMGGFKESASATRPCRTCLTTQDAWKLHFHENNFISRDAESHHEHVEAVSEPNVPKRITRYWQQRYGVNSKSPLSEIIDVTQCLPQDAMHIFAEGTVEISTRALLRYYIIERELFTLNRLNHRIENFDFGHFKVNKPGTISREHLERDSSLKQSASEMLGLAHTLPFLIGDWITAEQEILEPMLCHVRMLQILNICSAYEIHYDTIDLLARMIEVYVMKFNGLYPGWIVPKFHYLTHLPKYIKLFGPARQQWCFRFERAHQYYTQLVSVVRSFKNLPYTLSYRHQARLCSRLATYPGTESRQLLYDGDDINLDARLLLRNMPNEELLYNFIEEKDRETCVILRSTRIKSYGTVYEPDGIILLECNEDSLPVFGMITSIFVIDAVILLEYLTLSTLDYAEILNAYQIIKSDVISHDITPLKNLIFPHAIPRFKFQRNEYAVLLNHEWTEFVE